jgi:predicted Zn-dependent protease
MINQDIERSYVSPYDQFLFEFDATHPNTPSQIKEIQKNARIAALRDNPAPEPEGKAVWTEF